MSYSNYSSAIYGLEEHRRREEWEQAPKECPYCRARGEGHTPINQQYSAYGNDHPHQHCGSQACRQAHSRKTRAERLERDHEQARGRVLAYCDQHLTANQRHFVMVMFDQLVKFNPSQGHKIAETVVSAIEDKRCKHDRISQLEQYAALQKRRAEKTEDQLKARITELEAELALFNGLEATIHGIAKHQLRKQPDPEERPAPEPQTEQPDPDRERVLTILAKAGIPPYTGEEEEDLEE